MNIQKYLILLLILAEIYFISCSNSNLKSLDGINEGKYSFYLYDSLSNKLMEGILDIKSINLKKLQGEYEVQKKFVDVMGINSNRGKFEGAYLEKSKSLTINMNPKLSDANLFINAQSQNDSLIGDWYFSTMKGVQQRGKFRAFTTD